MDVFNHEPALAGSETDGTPDRPKGLDPAPQPHAAQHAQSKQSFDVRAASQSTSKSKANTSRKKSIAEALGSLKMQAVAHQERSQLLRAQFSLWKILSVLAGCVVIASAAAAAAYGSITLVLLRDWQPSEPLQGQAVLALVFGVFSCWNTAQFASFILQTTGSTSIWGYLWGVPWFLPAAAVGYGSLAMLHGALPGGPATFLHGLAAVFAALASGLMASFLKLRYTKASCDTERQFWQQHSDAITKALSTELSTKLDPDGAAALKRVMETARGPPATGCRKLTDRRDAIQDRLCPYYDVASRTAVFPTCPFAAVTAPVVARDARRPALCAIYTLALVLTFSQTWRAIGDGWQMLCIFVASTVHALGSSALANSIWATRGERVRCCPGPLRALLFYTESCVVLGLQRLHVARTSPEHRALASVLAPVLNAALVIAAMQAIQHRGLRSLYNGFAQMTKSLQLVYSTIGQLVAGTVVTLLSCAAAPANVAGETLVESRPGLGHCPDGSLVQLGSDVLPIVAIALVELLVSTKLLGIVELDNALRSFEPVLFVAFIAVGCLAGGLVIFAAAL